MKYCRIACALALMLFLHSACAQAAPMASPAQAASPADAQVQQTLRTAKEANMRVLPSYKGNLVQVLKKGTKVTVLDLSADEEENTWAHVRVVKGGKEGYILYSLLEEIPVETPTPAPTRTPSPTPKPTRAPAPTPDVPQEETFDEPLLARTTVRANLRKTPGGLRIAELPKNTMVSVLGQIEDEDGELWFHIDGEGIAEGYMVAELLRQIRPVQLLSLSEAEVREMFPVLSCDPLADRREAGLPAYSDEELAPYRTLDVGERSKAVLALKRRLYEMGYFTKPNENLNYTESTAEVIGRFQQDVGLPVTGVADPLTQAVLFDEHTPERAGSPQEPKYLDNQDAPLLIQRAEVTAYSFYGSVQLSLRNNSGARLTGFGLKIIPYMRDGSPADMADTFAEEIEREYAVRDIAIADGASYSDFITNNMLDDGIWPHHFQVSRKIYFSGAQLAVCWYRSGGTNIYVDDDQMVFVSAGDGAEDALIHTLPVALTRQEEENAGWEIGFVTRYVLPVYQAHYGLPQGAWIKSIEAGSPAQDAGLLPGDVVIGIGETTILGDATLRKARGQIAPGDSATLYFWRDGAYFATELIRPEAE